MPDGVVPPACFSGAWVRTGFVVDGAEVDDADVLWLQAGAWYTDLRVPHDDVGGPIEAFAGPSSWSPPMFRWNHHVDWIGTYPDDAGHCTFEGEVLIESGTFDGPDGPLAYTERWERRDPSGPRWAAAAGVGESDGGVGVGVGVDGPGVGVDGPGVGVDGPGVGIDGPDRDGTGVGVGRAVVVRVGDDAVMLADGRPGGGGFAARHDRRTSAGYWVEVFTRALGCDPLPRPDYDDLPGVGVGDVVTVGPWRLAVVEHKP